MSQGGNQQSQSYNTGSTYVGQPYWNPYANIFSNLSAQQAALPQASTALPTQPQTISQPGSATPSAQPALDQSQINMAAGLPAGGQTVQPFNINTAANTASVANPSPAPAPAAQANNVQISPLSRMQSQYGDARLRVT